MENLKLEPVQLQLGYPTIVGCDGSTVETEEYTNLSLLDIAAYSAATNAASGAVGLKRSSSTQPFHAQSPATSP